MPLSIFIVKNSFSGDGIRFVKEFLTIVFPAGIKCGRLGKYQYTVDLGIG